jgi:hypothetical protein
MPNSFGNSSVAGGAAKTPKLVGTMYTDGLAGNPQAGTPSAGVKATAVLLSTGVNVTDADTITVNDRTYRFKNTLALAQDIKIGADSDATLTSLVSAVNGTGVSGTDFFAGTTPPTGVNAAAKTGTGAAGRVTFTATTAGTAANSFASTKSAVTLTFQNGATFSGGAGADTTQLDDRAALKRAYPNYFV